MINNKVSKIKYCAVYGLREEKFKFLDAHSISNTKWQDLNPKEPNYFLVPKDSKGEEKYQKFISVKDIFEKYNAGVATGKDDVLVDFDKKSLLRKLSTFDKNTYDIAMQSYGVSKELAEKWFNELKKEDIENQIKKYNYRPFDSRVTIYNSKILQRARRDIMDNFLNNNVGLCTIKQYRLSSKKYFGFALLTENLTCRDLITNHTYIFPLYIYNSIKDNKQQSLLGEENNFGKKTNIKAEIMHKLLDFYKRNIKPEEVFYYIYAVLYSNKYRQKYNEFLKIDFPRVPFTSDYSLFIKLSKRGQELASLHLLKSNKLNKLSAKFIGSGANTVKKREYDQKQKRLYINGSQYFEGIESEVWNYYIGGYQVLDKWIKDRIDRNLSREEIEHYLKVIESLKNTIDLQKEIDEIYSEAEKSLIKY